MHVKLIVSVMCVFIIHSKVDAGQLQPKFYKAKDTK